ncbi:MAG: hypothetical protein KC593_04345 [Myxococcales bacterium]|nr:hypothetical protein [Myxococcales bacterium]MCB9629934.1 hypothetical protein [Sandaracinaceae bacterium]
MTSRRAPLGLLAIGLALMTSVPAVAQRSHASSEDTVDLQLSLGPCVARFEQRLREIIRIELRTSARVDERAVRYHFLARVRCVEGGVLLTVQSAGGGSEAEQFLRHEALRGPDPARTLALSIVELLEPAVLEAEAAASADAELAQPDGTTGEDDTTVLEDPGAHPDGGAAGAGAREGGRWGLAAMLSWRPSFGRHPHAGGVSLRGVRSFGPHLRVEFGGQLERGGRRVSLGRVVLHALTVDASVLTPLVSRTRVVLAVGAGARAGGVFFRGRPSAADVVASRFRSLQVELFARGVVDWYVAERWALRGDLEVGGALAGGRANAVENDTSTAVSTSGLRVALALGVMHAF